MAALRRLFVIAIFIHFFVAIINHLVGATTSTSFTSSCAFVILDPACCHRHHCLRKVKKNIDIRIGGDNDSCRSRKFHDRFSKTTTMGMVMRTTTTKGASNPLKRAAAGTGTAFGTLQHILRDRTSTTATSTIVSASDSDTTFNSIHPHTATATKTTVVKKKNQLQEGILFSSFTTAFLHGNTDTKTSPGTITNATVSAEPMATQLLQYSIVKVMLCRHQQSIEQQIIQSNSNSPCNGPNPTLLQQLDDVDDVLTVMKNWYHSTTATATSNSKNTAATTTKTLPLATALLRISSKRYAQVLRDSILNEPFRFVYIPTALYALNPDSSSTPGKQRQRARADGKKRRDRIQSFLLDTILQPLLLLLSEKEESTNDISNLNSSSTELPLQQVEAVTVDFSDGSVKQPNVLTCTNNITAKSSTESRTHTTKSSSIPNGMTGLDALTTWSPHLVYVEGGNTFWLIDCIEQYGWKEPLLKLVCDSATVYCGASAGAIIAGEMIETACWKGWDDPRVCTNRTTYSDWVNVSGLNMLHTTTNTTSSVSVFPHYNPTEHKGMVEQKQNEIRQRRRHTQQQNHNNINNNNTTNLEVTNNILVDDDMDDDDDGMMAMKDGNDDDDDDFVVHCLRDDEFIHVSSNS